MAQVVCRALCSAMLGRARMELKANIPAKPSEKGKTGEAPAPSSVSALAAVLPLDTVSTRKTKASFASAFLASQRKELNDFLDEASHKVGPCLAALRGSMLYGACVSKKQVNVFFGREITDGPRASTHHVHKKIPRYFVAHFLVNACNLSKPLLLKVDGFIRSGEKGYSQLRQLLCFMTGCGEWLALATLCHDNFLLVRLYTSRWKRNGSRGDAKWLGDFVDEVTGEVDWKQRRVLRVANRSGCWLSCGCDHARRRGWLAALGGDSDGEGQGYQVLTGTPELAGCVRLDGRPRGCVLQDQLRRCVREEAGAHG